MIDPRIVSRLTHVDSFTHTYICIYTSTHTRRYDPRYSYLRFSFVFIPKEIVSNERIVAVLEIRRFMIRKIRAFCYYVPSRTLHCLVCTISQKSFHCTFNILSLSLVYNYSFFLLLFFFFLLASTRFHNHAHLSQIFLSLHCIMLPRDFSIYHQLPSITSYLQLIDYRLCYYILALTGKNQSVHFRNENKEKKRKKCPTRNQTNLRALTRTIAEQIHISTPTTTNARSIIYLYARSDRFNAQTVKPLSRKYFSIGGIHRNNPRSPRENIRYGG